MRAGLGAPEQPAAAGSCSPHVTSRGSDIVEIQNSRWLFGLFFFFFRSHFQGNKTRCHLPVAIAISPDSASAAQRKRKPGELSSLLPRSRELVRVQSSWGEQEINGALSEEAMG